LKARVDEVTVEAADLTFVDETTDEPANIRISPLNLKMVNLSNEKGAEGANVELSLTVAKSGKISINGPLTVDPLRANLAVDVKTWASGLFSPTSRIK